MKQITLVFILAFWSLNILAQVDRVATKDFSIVKNGSTLTIPYASSQSIATEDVGLKYLVFSIHGVNRNADDYYDRMVAAQSVAGEDGDSTLIIAPQFLTESDIEAFSLGSNYIYWSSGGWIAGSNSRNESSNPRPERIPSYEVLDSMILRIIKMNPSIEYITLVGHSAGGQVVQHYAATSPVAEEEDVIDQRIRFIVANPSSYVYIDNKRRVSGTVDQFAVPNTSCTDYNEWKYGLDELYTYPSRQGAEKIRTNYKVAEVIYLLGGDDNDPSSTSLDTDCAAQIQGSHRLERGTVYFNYLKDYYGEEVHQLDTVPNVGHSSTGMFASAEGVFHIFEVIGSKSTTTSTRVFVNELGSLSAYPNPSANWVEIKSPSRKSQNVVYRVMDMTGRLQLQLETSSDSPRMDISKLRPGIYFIHAILGLQIYQEKLLKL